MTDSIELADNLDEIAVLTSQAHNDPFAKFKYPKTAGKLSPTLPYLLAAYSPENFFNFFDSVSH